MSSFDKNCQFIVENYDEILSLQKILKYTEKNLPDWLNATFKAAVNDMDKFFDQEGLNLEFEDTDTPEWFYWYDPRLYDSHKKIGLYFSFDCDKWDYIFTGEDPDPNKSATLYVQLDMEEVGKKRQNVFFNKIIKKISMPENIKILKSNKIRICKDFDMDEPKILEYSLTYDINMKTLRNYNSLTTVIQSAIKKFASATHPILKKLNGNLRMK
jgi:hypothetical protein